LEKGGRNGGDALNGEHETPHISHVDKFGIKRESKRRGTSVTKVVVGKFRDDTLGCNNVRGGYTVDVGEIGG